MHTIDVFHIHCIMVAILTDRFLAIIDLDITLVTISGHQLTHCNPHVPFETTLLREFPITVPTLEGFLMITSVGPHVCCEMTLPTKFPIAVPTLERLLTSVGQHVPLEIVL